MIAVWNETVSGLALAGSPETLAARQPAWQPDVAALAPWRPGPLPGRGGVAWIASQSLLATRTAATPDPWILIVENCSSCLDVAWHLLRADSLPPDAAVLAGQQWAGRGQLGRTWSSPPGNLHAAWRVPYPPEISLAIRLGQGIISFLLELGVQAELKWPNDVLVGGKKVGGILCEQREGITVAGIGLNLVSCPKAGELREEPAAPAGTLAEQGPVLRPLPAWLRLANGTRTALRLGAAALAEAVNARLAYRGQWVEIFPGQGPPFTARVEGIEPDGALRVRTDHGGRRLVSASLRPLEFNPGNRAP